MNPLDDITNVKMYNAPLSKKLVEEAAAELAKLREKNEALRVEVRKLKLKITDLKLDIAAISATTEGQPSPADYIVLRSELWECRMVNAEFQKLLESTIEKLQIKLLELS